MQKWVAGEQTRTDSETKRWGANTKSRGIRDVPPASIISSSILDKKRTKKERKARRKPRIAKSSSRNDAKFSNSHATRLSRTPIFPPFDCQRTVHVIPPRSYLDTVRYCTMHSWVTAEVCRAKTKTHMRSIDRSLSRMSRQRDARDFNSILALYRYRYRFIDTHLVSRYSAIVLAVNREPRARRALIIPPAVRNSAASYYERSTVSWGTVTFELTGARHPSDPDKLVQTSSTTVPSSGKPTWKEREEKKRKERERERERRRGSRRSFSPRSDTLFGGPRDPRIETAIAEWFKKSVHSGFDPVITISNVTRLLGN